MRLAGLALLVAACSGPVAERAAKTEPSVTHDPMAPWKALEIRGRNYEAKLASIPEDQRRDMAIAFLREGDVGCKPVTMSLPCGEQEYRFPPVLPSHDLTDGCLRRRIAIWALEQLDGDTILRELAAVAKTLVRLRPPETELPRLVIEKVESPASLARLIGIANEAGHEDLADQAVARVPDKYLEDLAFEHGVDAAFEAVIRDRVELSDKEQWKSFLSHPLRRDTGLRVIEQLRAEGDAELDLVAMFALTRDCITYVAGKDVIDRAASQSFTTPSGGWQLHACVALRTEGAASPELRGLISPQGLRVEVYKDHPNDDDEDRVWHDHRKNDASFKMPFAEELKDVLADC